ncbi:hypothetical protein [Novosphingobium album (ex Liu et al. 2023)]|uniref:DUF296 domain-containing protein n=1 Tax=Novosphingobium album (ex Liu et al. 2023) TaxID=3031130 RepID=A0ABT5WW53_9SPHN|nr:hypothetical protein [Novosphingobium album (ex Liu et al. 2023)]MDE8654117.1 hypothetical protein [Novosphingobium album (ex Liu et al. 2023)]
MQIDSGHVRAMIAALRERGHKGVWLSLLGEVLGLAGGRAEFLRHEERTWSSATFSGARHTILLAFSGLEAIAAGETFIAALPDHEFTLPRHLVADAGVIAVEHVAGPRPCMTVEAELLLLDDA